MQYAVTNRIAYLPNDHNRIYESRSQSTAARRDALMNVNTTTKKTTVDLQQVTDRNKAGSRSMEEWMQDVASEADMKLHDPDAEPLESRDAELQRKHLEQAYYMDQIRKDEASGLNDKTKNILDRSIRDRIKRAHGAGEMGPVDKRRSALYQSRSGNADLNVGAHTPLARPNSADAIVKDPLLTQGRKQLVGVDAAVRRRDNKPDQLELQFIEDPGQVTKEMTAGAKGGTQGVTASPVVGQAGEQAIMEAPFMKAHRRDFAGYPRAQIERMYNRAVEELQRETLSGGPYNTGCRERVMQRFTGALSEISGMEQSKIRWGSDGGRIASIADL